MNLISGETVSSIEANILQGPPLVHGEDLSNRERVFIEKSGVSKAQLVPIAAFVDFLQITCMKRKSLTDNSIISCEINKSTK